MKILLNSLIAEILADSLTEIVKNRARMSEILFYSNPIALILDGKLKELIDPYSNCEYISYGRRLLCIVI